MNVIMKKTADITPYAKNAKKHSQTQIENVAQSIKEYGFVQPVVIDKKGVIVIGHCRVMAAKLLGMEEVPCVCVEDLSPGQVNALRIIDNKTNESDWDMDLLLGELEELDLSGFDLDFSIAEPQDYSEFEANSEAEEEGDGEGEEDRQGNPYTMNIDAPEYQITGEKPGLSDLVDTSKVDQLVAQIRDADIPNDVRQFLICAAQRHLKFDYARIAEFYAHSSIEVQELFEQSALVIIDFDAAIKNGFTKLSKRIEAMRDGE